MLALFVRAHIYHQYKLCPNSVSLQIIVSLPLLNSNLMSWRLTLSVIIICF